VRWGVKARRPSHIYSSGSDHMMDHMFYHMLFVYYYLLGVKSHVGQVVGMKHVSRCVSEPTLPTGLLNQR